MITLSNLVSVHKKRKKIGRGGSRGGTSGKGHKGQKARTSGTVRALFEGGQTSLNRRLPKRGFTNGRFKKEVEVVNLNRLDECFEHGFEVTHVELINKGIISGKKGIFIKILGDGTLSKKLTVHADACSQTALDAIRKLGGEVVLTRGE
jgi:large subunit ribosomal protein L15